MRYTTTLGIWMLSALCPAGALLSGTLASEGVDASRERTRVVADIDPCLLVAGSNLLAVEVHQASPTSSDVSFDLTLAADRDPGAVSPCSIRFARGDCNGDGSVAGVTDAIFQLSYDFMGGPPPGAPLPDCGPESLPPDVALDSQSSPPHCQ